MTYLEQRRKFIEDGRPLPTKKKYFIPKKSAKRFEKEKEQKIEIVNPKKRGFFDASMQDNEKLNSEILFDQLGGVDESLQNLSNDLDLVLSQYLRHKNVDKEGNCTCFVCGDKIPLAKAQNSHYKKRSHRSTRHMEQNCRVSCEKCNQLHDTNEEPYKEALEAEYNGITTWLDEQASTVYKATRNDLKQALIEYRAKLEILKRKFETK